MESHVISALGLQAPSIGSCQGSTVGLDRVIFTTDILSQTSFLEWLFIALFPKFDLASSAHLAAHLYKTGLVKSFFTCSDLGIFTTLQSLQWLSIA